MTIIDNFSLKGKSFMDGRQGVATVAALKAIPETDVPDGFRVYCAETKRWYEYNSANTVNSIFGRWLLADAHANEAAEAKIKEAVTDKLGKPNGIAPIGENGLIDSRFIPGSYDDVVDLDGMVSGVEAVAVTNTMAGSSAKCTKLYYDTTYKRLVGSFADGTYHYWAADEEDDESDVAAQYRRYMLPGGTPLKGKIYIDTTTNRQYRWSGSALVELGKQMALGAVEGTGNVITEITVDDNVIKPKKGATMATEEEFHALDVAFDSYKEQMTNTLADKADKSDITAVLTNLGDTNTNVSKNATAINTLVERADSLDNDISNINQYASEQNTRITDLETEKANNSTVTALATRVSSLEAAEPDSISVSEIEALFA